MILNLDGIDVEIDDDIADSIIELNKKGYKTFTCCSGHNTKEFWYGYIYFETRLLKKYGKPEGWFYEKDIFPDAVIEEKGRKNLIRYVMDEDVENKQKIIKQKMKDLKIWVKSLPDINNNISA